MTNFSQALKSDGTSVSTLASGVFALATTVAVYELFLLRIPEEAPPWLRYISALFVERGWVPYAETFVTAWALALLVRKYAKLRGQRDATDHDPLPDSIAPVIAADTVARFVEHVDGLAQAHRSPSFFLQRVRRALGHFGGQRTRSEVSAFVAAQSEIDATTVELSYTLVKVFIWAIPILGFIGTVIGISDAVTAFASAVDAAKDLQAIKGQLNQVAKGLATAFDTTLLALVMSVIIMIPASALQRAEERLLNWIDAYCGERLLERLREGRGLGEQSLLPAVRQAVDHAVRGHEESLARLTAALGRITAEAAKAGGEAWKEVVDHAASTTRAQTAAVERVAEALGGLGKKAAELARAVDAIEGAVARHQAGWRWRVRWRAAWLGGGRGGAPTKD